MSRRPTRDVASIYSTRRFENYAPPSILAQQEELAIKIAARRQAKAKYSATQRENPWVQCNSCKKWRKLPLGTDVSSLPNLWYCKMNTWDVSRNRCEVEQEDSQSSSLKSDVQGHKSESNINQAESSAVKKTSSKSKSEKSSKEEENPWVQCNTCNKWRKLPLHVNVNSLPNIWNCSLNEWDAARNNCSVPEEEYDEKIDEPLKSFFKIWLKKIRSGDKAEMRLPPSAVARGRKRKLESEWIRCCNPSCGKWRSLSVRGIDASQVLKTLNKDRHWVDKKPLVWYCSMNSWDETKASCGAPQEPIFDAPWNVPS